MIEREEEEVLKRIKETIQEQGRKKTILAEHLGYTGKTATKIRSVDKILKGQKILTTELLNTLSDILFTPAGYFLFGEKDSPIHTIDDDIIIKNLYTLFEEELEHKRLGKKKYQLGKAMGCGGDDTAKIQIVNRTLQKKRKMSVTDIITFSHFFGLKTQEIVTPLEK